MVSTPFTTHITNTVTSIKVSRPFHATQGKSSFDRPGKFTPPGIDSFRERLYVEAISEESAALITSAGEQGTNSDHKLVWRKWYSWCSERQADLINYSINMILQYLT